MAYSRSKARQEWAVGLTVKVGYHTLKITGRSYDGWFLESLNGTKHYEFQPYRGLFRMDDVFVFKAVN